MRDYQLELEERVRFIQECLASASAQGIVFGNSGGKDSALVGILCKLACANTVGLIMPCRSQRSFDLDRQDGEELAQAFGIEVRVVNLQPVFEAAEKALEGVSCLTELASANLAPRLRMAALYAVAASENRLVAGTGNRSELHLGYFTKWGDCACDFNPIADLTVTEVYQFLRFLQAPACILEKAPSAALFDGQTDEGELGLSYGQIDTYLLGQPVTGPEREIIERYHRASAHKRRMPLTYGERP